MIGFKILNNMVQNRILTNSFAVFAIAVSLYSCIKTHRSQASSIEKAWGIWPLMGCAVSVVLTIPHVPIFTMVAMVLLIVSIGSLVWHHRRIEKTVRKINYMASHDKYVQRELALISITRGNVTISYPQMIQIIRRAEQKELHDKKGDRR